MHSLNVSSNKRRIKRIANQNLDDLQNLLLKPEQKKSVFFMRFHLVYIQVTNQIMHRHKRAIHYYIKWLHQDQSKQIQRKYWKNILGQQNKVHQIMAKLLWGPQQQNFREKLLLKSHMVIPKKKPCLNSVQSQCKVNARLRWISPVVYFTSLVRLIY